MSKIKITPSMFRSGVKWLGKLLLLQIATLVIYAVALNGIVSPMYANDDRAGAYRLLFFISLVFMVIGCFVLVRLQMSFSDVRTGIITASREEGYRPLHHFFRTLGYECGWKSLFLLVMQIPFAFFFASFGVALDNSALPFENFYILEAGFYTITGSALAGILLSTLCFFALLLLFSALFYFRLLRDKY